MYFMTVNTMFASVSVGVIVTYQSHTRPRTVSDRDRRNSAQYRFAFLKNICRQNSPGIMKL